MTDRETGLKKGLGVRTRRIIAYIVLGILSFLCLVWFYILFVNATRGHSDISVKFSALPGTELISNWKEVMAGTLPLWSGLANSLIVSVGSAALSVYFSTMTAYAIHAYDFKGRNATFKFILMIMMIPTQVTALGFLQLMRNMNLVDSLIPFIIPAIAAPVTFFYMKQYMESSLPLEIIEAARIDGSNEFRTFNTIVLPLMRPAIAVQAIFTFVSSWNNYFVPALLLKSDSKKTLPILIATLRSADFLNFDLGQVYVTIAFSIFPVIIMYLILSKHIVDGVAAGGVKG